MAAHFSRRDPVNIGLVLSLLAIPLLWWVSQPVHPLEMAPQGFVLFHPAAEIFAVVVAMLIFVTGQHAFLSARKGAVLLLGVCFLGGGLLNFLQILSFPGMSEALSANSPHKAMVIWLAARLLAAGALLVYVLWPSVPAVSGTQKHLALAWMLVSVSLVVGLGLYGSDRLPALLEQGRGLTPLKIALEWLVVGMGLASLGVLWFRRMVLSQAVATTLTFAVGLSATSELFLMAQGGVFDDVSSVIGHSYKIAAYLFLFYATFNIRDWTERKKFDAALQFQATHDELTGLPNRWLFHVHLDQAVARSVRSGGRSALLLLDLDNFKTVNDTFGHATGDALLVQAGERMRAVLRASDILVRLGGDEFAILLTDVTSNRQVERVASKLLAALKPTYRLQHLDVSSGGSLGVAFCPDDAKDSTTLMRYADLAMYRAKETGRGTFVFFSQGMDSRLLEDMLLHKCLKEAMSLGKLDLYYQPQVDVPTGAIVGAEALLRWFDPVLGHVSPAKFIPVAEATGLILALSDWVLDTACRQIAAWAQAGTPLQVAINVSAQQFQQLDLPHKVSEALARTGAQARWLTIEITESVAMTRPEQAREQLDALVALGCCVALDDFGTGYSSLAYLKALPVHKLKIDKRFLDGIPADMNDAAISCAIIAMAHSLGMSVIAEGVETEAQLTFLNQHGCETYQGWLFAKAIPADEMTRLIMSKTIASCH